MIFAQAFEQLRLAGTAQTRKTYLRHGVSEPMFGVSYADLGKLAKKAGTDQDLAPTTTARRQPPTHRSLREPTAGSIECAS